MNLSGQQWKNLQEALINAFPDKQSLEQMLLFELEKNLDAIAEGGSLEKIVFYLIKTAVANGWVIDLICAAKKSNPRNEYLIAIAKEFRPGQCTTTLPHLLFKSLLRLDFKQQVQLVKDVMKLHRTAAFLVHGKPYYGQQLLVTRLLQLKPEWKKISPVKIDVSQKGVGQHIPYLWRQLTSWFGLGKDAEPKQIIQRICDRFSTQDVIFIFYTVECMLPQVLKRWVEEFWGTLVAQVEANCPPTQPRRHLLMFLVDNGGSVCNSNILLAKQFDEPNYPRIPLHLPPINPFPLDVLNDWVMDTEMEMNMETIPIPTGFTPKILLEKTDNGIPELVYEEICMHFNLSWEGDLAKWLI